MNRSQNSAAAAAAANLAQQDAEKDKRERNAESFFKWIKQRDNWNSIRTRQQFANLYAEFCNGTDPKGSSFRALWHQLCIVVETWYFIRYLRHKFDGQQKLTKEQLRNIYVHKYRAHIQDDGANNKAAAGDSKDSAAAFSRVLKLALFRGKLLELGGYIYVGDTESAVAEMFTRPPDHDELMRRAAKRRDKPDRYCSVCDLFCQDDLQLNQHLSGRRHKIQQAISDIRDSSVKHQLLQDKHDVLVTSDAESDLSVGTFTLVMDLNKQETFKITVTNISRSNKSQSQNASNPFLAAAMQPSLPLASNSMFDGTLIVEQFLFLFKIEGVIFNDQNRGIIRGRPMTLASGESCNIRVIVMPQSEPGRFVVPVVLSFYRKAFNQRFRILRFVKIECVRDKQLYNALKPRTAGSSASYLSTSTSAHKGRPNEGASPSFSSPANSPRDQVQKDKLKAKPEVKNDSLQNSFAQMRISKQPDVETTKPKATLVSGAVTAGWRNQTGRAVQDNRASIAVTNTATNAVVRDANVRQFERTTLSKPAPCSSVRLEGNVTVVEAPKLPPINELKPFGLELGKLGEHPIPDNFIRLYAVSERMVSAKGRRMTMADEVMHNVLKQKVDESNFTVRFDMLLFIEEAQMHVDLKRYTMKNVRMHSISDEEYTLSVPGAVENRPSVLRGDVLLVTLPDKPNTVYEAVVTSVNIDGEQAQKNNTAILHLRFGQSFNYLKNQANATVAFQFNRLSLRFQHETLQTLKLLFSQSVPASNSNAMNRLNDDLDVSLLRALLFPNRSRYGAYKRQPRSVVISHFFNSMLNEEQKQCVQRIVSGDHYPVPFLIFGPPGTGKTFTLSEAVRQIHRSLPKSFVLVCAPENTSADHLIQTILHHGSVQRREILRLYAATQYDNVPDFIGTVGKCDFEFIEDGYPEAKTIQSYRIVVTTLNTASRLVYSGFPRSHFTHLFIDEAGHAMESEVLVPIVGLLDLKKPDGGQLIMAGDPRQLGVTVRSKVAREYNLEISFLERLIDAERQHHKQNAGVSNIYFTQANAGGNASVDSIHMNIPPLTSNKVEYDDRVLVKLRRNYRSHDAIIAFSRSLFYHGELDACADKMSSSALIGWEELPNSNFPIIFHPVLGSDEREAASPSYFNRHEVVAIDAYLRALLIDKRGFKVEAKDIGIISPYIGQNSKIRQMIRVKQYDQIGKSASSNRSDVGILVGTVEEFQGQERAVIIISTVRSSEKLLRKDCEFQIGMVDYRKKEGFNVSTKRLNVALTRAKSLLIVVGNPFILENDINWKRWLDYCETNNAWKTPRSRFEKQRNAALVNDVLVDDNINLEDETGSSVVELQEEPRWVRRE